MEQQVVNEPIVKSSSRIALARFRSKKTVFNRSLLFRFVFFLLIALMLAVSIFLAVQRYSIVPLLGVGSFCVFVLLVVLLTMKQRAIFLYLWKTRQEQKMYSKLYTSLSSLSDVYETPIVSSTKEASNAGQDVQEAVQQESNLMLLGLPGAGKTTVLRVYQHKAFTRFWKLIWGKGQIPVYIPMKDYAAFLKKVRTPEAPEQATFLNYRIYQTQLYQIHQNSEAGIRHLSPYIERFIKQGRLLLLCDGLNEIDNRYLTVVCDELKQFMREHSNRVVMTCREAVWWPTLSMLFLSEPPPYLYILQNN